MFNDFQTVENNSNFPKYFEKAIYKMKMFKRSLKNYITDKKRLEMSKRKFSSLDIQEVHIFMKRIIIAENYNISEFKLTESLPGLFTIEYKN